VVFTYLFDDDIAVGLGGRHSAAWRH